jgi:hypothetical protein
MGIGAVAEAVGILGGIAASSTWSFTLFVAFGCVGGAICLIVGLTLILVGTAKALRAKRMLRKINRSE